MMPLFVFLERCSLPPVQFILGMDPGSVDPPGSQSDAKSCHGGKVGPNTGTHAACAYHFATVRSFLVLARRTKHYVKAQAMAQYPSYTNSQRERLAMTQTGSIYLRKAPVSTLTFSVEAGRNRANILTFRQRVADARAKISHGVTSICIQPPACLSTLHVALSHVASYSASHTPHGEMEEKRVRLQILRRISELQFENWRRR